MQNHLTALKKMAEIKAPLPENGRDKFTQGLLKVIKDVWLDINDKDAVDLYYHFNQNYKAYDFKDPHYVLLSEKLDGLIESRMDDLSEDLFCTVFYYAARSKRNMSMILKMSNYISKRLDTMEYSVACQLLLSMRVQKDCHAKTIKLIMTRGLNNPEIIENLDPPAMINLMFCLSKELADEQLNQQLLQMCIKHLGKIFDSLGQISLEFTSKILHTFVYPEIFKNIQQQHLKELRLHTVNCIEADPGNLDILTAASVMYGYRCLNDAEVCSMIVNSILKQLFSIEVTKVVFILSEMPFSESGKTKEIVNYVMTRIKESYDKIGTLKNRQKATLIGRNLRWLTPIILRGYQIPNNIQFLALNSLKPEVLGSQVVFIDDYVLIAYNYYQFVQSVNKFRENFDLFCLDFAKKYTEGFFLQDRTFGMLERQCAILEALMRSPLVTQDAKLMKRVTNVALAYFPAYLQQLIDHNCIELNEPGIAFLKLLDKNREYLTTSTKHFRDCKKYFKLHPSLLNSVTDPQLLNLFV